MGKGRRGRGISGEESMYKRIVVAVDSSQTSELALETAVKLAVETGARLRIAHAIDLATLNVGVEFPIEADFSGSMIEGGKTLLARCAKVAAAAGIEAETQLVTIDSVSQRITEAIVEDADSWSADLVVVGTHGRHGLSRLFLGSVAEGVARVAHQPVLLVRGK